MTQPHCLHFCKLSFFPSSFQDPYQEGDKKSSWWVPLTYTTEDKANFTHPTTDMLWMKPSDERITILDLPNKNNWVIFNLQETGYYRVIYDNDNWLQILRQLAFDYNAIDSINRAQIIDDSLNLAKTG